MQSITSDTTGNSPRPLDISFVPRPIDATTIAQGEPRLSIYDFLVACLCVAAYGKGAV